MSWEMAMARPLISCRPQIPWDPARGQETGAPLECQMVCLILLSKKKEVVSERYPWMGALALPGAERWLGMWEGERS